jgi:arylsulfatase
VALNGSIAYWDSFKHEMWRFVVPGQIIAKYIPSPIEYPQWQIASTLGSEEKH